MIKQWRVNVWGEPEAVMELAKVPVPQPAEGEVLISVEAVALNFADTLVCRGQYQERPAFPFTPGFEAAGRVEKVGVGCDPSLEGQAVFVIPKLPRGAMSEKIVAPAADLLPLPDSFPLHKAAALGAYQTSHAALHRRAQIRAGETLLVHAASGGVGSAAVQLGKAAGARVIATVGGPNKVNVARQLGADHVIDYTVDDFATAVKELTGDRGADVVFDPVGGDVFDRSRKCIAFEGRIVVVGFAGGRIPDVSCSHVLVKNYSIVGLHFNLYHRLRFDIVREIHADLLRLHEEGAIDPLIGAEIPFEEAPKGLRHIAERHSVGKTILRLGERS